MITCAKCNIELNIHDLHTNILIFDEFKYLCCSCSISRLKTVKSPIVVPVNDSGGTKETFDL